LTHLEGAPKRFFNQGLLWIANQHSIHSAATSSKTSREIDWGSRPGSETISSTVALAGQPAPSVVGMEWALMASSVICAQAAILIGSAQRICLLFARHRVNRQRDALPRILNLRLCRYVFSTTQEPATPSLHTLKETSLSGQEAGTFTADICPGGVVPVSKEHVA
jgi:hypothetical protein